MNLFTLWDPASNDTLDCTDYAGDVRLFVEGSDQFSDVSDNFFQFTQGTSIKNIITGLGNNRIYAGNTVITTGSSYDTIYVTARSDHIRITDFSATDKISLAELFQYAQC